MRNILIVILCCLFCSKCLAVDPNWSESQWTFFLNAIRQVETGGKPNEGIGIKGDNGKAYGPYQIREAYFQDALKYDDSIVGSWEDCLKDKALSEEVVIAYIKKYLPEKGTVEDAARIHNGGPKGYKRRSTVDYETKFKAVYYQTTVNGLTSADFVFVVGIVLILIIIALNA